MSVKRITTETAEQVLHLSSKVFRANALLDSRFTCDGPDINPPLLIHHVPFNTESMALLVLDVDAPSGEFVHWVVWNIQPTQVLRENHVPGVEGVNDYRQHHYRGPCPPSGKHKYIFRVYALDSWLDLPPSSSWKDLQDAMENHVLAMGELPVYYKRQDEA